MARDVKRRDMVKGIGAVGAAGLTGLAGCIGSTGGSESPDTLIIIGYPTDGIQLFKDLYESVKTGKETEIVLRVNSAPDYQEKLDAELKEIHDSEMWKAGAAVRSLRPENWKK